MEILTTSSSMKTCSRTQRRLPLGLFMRSSTRLFLRLERIFRGLLRGREVAFSWQAQWWMELFGPNGSDKAVFHDRLLPCSSMANSATRYEQRTLSRAMR